MKRILPVLVVMVLAGQFGWPASDAELTAPAAHVFAAGAPAGQVTDGVAVWTDWLPLAGPWVGGSEDGERWIQWGLWIAFALAIYGLSRSLGSVPWAAAVSACLVACHPISVALHGDLAGRGLLVAGLFMLLTTWAFRAALEHDGPGLQPLVVIALGTLLGGMAHPLAMLVPFVLVLTVLLVPDGTRRSPFPVRQVMASALPVLALIAARWLMELPADIDLLDHEGVSEGDEVAPLTGLFLAGRTIASLAPTDWVVRRPCEGGLESVGFGSLWLWIGALALLVVPMVARRSSVPSRSLGLWWFWALLVALSQVAEPFPSAIAPGAVALCWVGLALLVGSLATNARVQTGLLVGAVVMGGLTVPGAQRGFASELAALETRVDHCVGNPEGPVRLARYLARDGEHRRALEVLEDVEGPGAASMRIELHLAKRSWGRARQEMGRLTGDEALVWRCRAGAIMSEVTAVRACEAAREQLGDRGDLVSAQVKALGRDRRGDEAEALARAQLELHPRSEILHEALVALLEDVGYMGDAVVAMDAWLQVTRTPEPVRQRLVRGLERKGKGDLMAGRAKEALHAFERALTLAPDHHQLRYHLAQAHQDLGDRAAANRERERARDAGASPPVHPLQMRGMPRLPAP